MPPTASSHDAGQATQEGDIVVTGSRIRRDNFNTPSPVTIVTRDDSVLAGATSTAETLQSATITSGTSQISGGFLGFVSEGGAAANTVGLRGLGSQRTLVLLNGRRLAPAGVGNQLVAADINVLPAAIVQRIEGCARALGDYGSDAIAASSTSSPTPRSTASPSTLSPIPQDMRESNSAGRTYRGSITAGKTFDAATSPLGRLSPAKRRTPRRPERVGMPARVAPPGGEEIGQIDPATAIARSSSSTAARAASPAVWTRFWQQHVRLPVFGTRNLPGYTTDNPTIGDPVVVTTTICGRAAAGAARKPRCLAIKT